MAVVALVFLAIALFDAEKAHQLETKGYTGDVVPAAAATAAE